MADIMPQDATAPEENFNLAFYKLLEKHPLYDYQVKVKSGFRTDDGIHPRMILAVPNLPQFNDRNELSDPVKQALSRGVYLLGRECFRGNHLPEVLNHIAQCDPHWCDFLANQKATT